MLRALSIRNVLLIDQLDLVFNSGLGVLTGETGAGKSILLEAMGLALGGRASPQMIRVGQTQATVTAEFEQREDSSAYSIIQELGFHLEEQNLLLRRTIALDGRSRAFLNDQPISLATLRTLGDALVEVHGQFDHLLNPSNHRQYLDLFGGLSSECENVRTAFKELEKKKIALHQHRLNIEHSKERALFLSHSLNELKEASPQKGEEEYLLQEREYLLHHTKIIEASQTAYSVLAGERGVETLLSQAIRSLERVSQNMEGFFKEALAALERAIAETQEAVSLLSETSQERKNQTKTLEDIDNRLYLLRALARKHSCTIDELGRLHQNFQQQYDDLEHSDTSLRKLEQDLEKAKEIYLQQAISLRKKRQEAAHSLQEAMHKEFVPLKLEKASFRVNFTSLPEEEWGSSGIDRLEFQVQTNLGMPEGSFSKIASGGERSRIMLALKTLLAHESRISLIIFDEIDVGVGGAVASAIGERLYRLGRELQVLAVTHSPQVAAYADYHWKVTKEVHNQKTIARLELLNQEQSEQEIARMLAGETVTQEAHAAARRLLKAARSA
jgi:DNA repair protein RecN (Recombination protein N)